jgi:hypothetical protein
MLQSLLISSLILIAAAVAFGYILVKRRERREKIAEILSGSNLLADWAYTPDEWRRAAEEEFTWVRDRDSGGHVYLSPTMIYIKNDSEDRLIDLDAGGKVVTHASYRASEMSPLKLRVRWKVVTEHRGGSNEVKYYKEDYRIPVPLRYQEEARRVADFFTARLENNLEAYADVVSDDEPLSLFGKDDF